MKESLKKWKTQFNSTMKSMNRMKAWMKMLILKINKEMKTNR